MDFFWSLLGRYHPITELEEAISTKIGVKGSELIDLTFNYQLYELEQIETLFRSGKGSQIGTLTVWMAPPLLDLTLLVNLKNVKVVASPGLREVRGSFTTLDLSDNDLTVMPSIPFTVTDLDLSYNYFPLIPSRILPKNLKTLRLTGNRQLDLKDLQLEERTSITTLGINHLGLCSVPPLPPRIRSLDLAMNDLTYLGEEVFLPYLETLETVDLRFNLLKVVPANLGLIKNLYLDETCVYD
jgi:hypothetical protein